MFLIPPFLIEGCLLPKPLTCVTQNETVTQANGQRDMRTLRL